jgi:hypothetical protein
MNPAFIRKAAALPARQLHLMGAGLLLVAAAALWFYALRAPLAALRVVRAEQAQLNLAGSDPRLLAAQLALLERDTETLAKGFGDAAAQPAAQVLVQLIDRLGALAQAQGVTLHAVNPAPEETVLAFIQAWMEAIERAQPNLAIAGFEMRPAETPGQVVLKIRIAAFRPQESKP